MKVEVAMKMNHDMIEKPAMKYSKRGLKLMLT